MDIKLKKYRPFWVWLCFFIGVNIIGFFVLFVISLAEDLSYFDMAILGSDIKETQEFKHEIALKFNILARCINENADNNESFNEWIKELDDEGENLIYYAENPHTGKIVTNSESDLGISVKGFPLLPEGYDYYIYFNGSEFIVENDGKPIDVYRDDSGYKNTVLYKYFTAAENEMKGMILYTYSEIKKMEINGVEENAAVDIDINNIKERLRTAAGEYESQEIVNIADCHIFLVVKENLVENPYAISDLYRLKEDTRIGKIIIYCIIVIFFLGIALVIFSIIKRRYKLEFNKKAAQILGRIYFEIKILISIAAIMIFYSFCREIFESSPVSSILIIPIILICFWWIYFMGIDLRFNGRKFFFKNFIRNFINWGIRQYKTFERKRPFQKALLMRIYTLIAVEIALVLLTVMFLFLTASLIPIVVFPALGFYLLYRYLRHYTRTVNDIGKVIDQTERIKNGDINTKLYLEPDSDLYVLQENLNQIQEGISKATEEKLRSERMKVELVTNVSHDLKTPLTSIISYVDLLSKEKGLPEHVNDYIKILARKSERLKVLIQDLFDLSKATSGNMELNIERLDLGKLIQQTLGDLDEQIENSSLIFKVNIPDYPVVINSDGKKLYRVFLNLFQNALKYSMAGSRVYVDLIVDNGKSVVTIKNVANYEMNFDEKEIVERFVRGDKARSGEGSGLGLAISQSFTQACGGNFEVKIDGDLFKVILSFPISQRRLNNFNS